MIRREFIKVDETYIKRIFPRRRCYSEFGDNGRLLIIGGSKIFSSQPLISGLAAEYTGLDSIYLAVPEKISSIIKSYTLSITIIPMPDMKITKGVVNKILKLIERRKVSIDTVMIGPGLTGIGKEISILAYKISKLGLNILIDSGAIYSDLIRFLKGSNILITPKAGELKIILNKEITELNDDILNNIIDLCKEYRYTLLLKSTGRYMTFSPEGKIYIIDHPVPIHTKYGISYVLTGLAAGFLARTKKPVYASILASYFTVKTCENVYEKYGFHYTIEDILDTLKNILKEYDYECVS